MRYLALLMIGCLSLPAYALTQVDIYRTEVAIDANQEKGEELARQQAMQQVIVRASGYQDAASNPVVTKALQSSARYISQLSYGKQGDVTSLKLLFNDAQIRTLLTQAQLPFWPINRSNVLVWLVEEQNYERNVVWEHSVSQLAETLRNAASERGLPITLPIGDFDDITGIEVSDLWGGFAAPISTASRRYPVEGVLVIRAQDGTLRWSLYDQSPAKMVEANVVPLSGVQSGDDAAIQLINEIADFYAKRSAVFVLGESSESVAVKFLNINNAFDFFTLEQTLTSLSSVASIDVLEIKGNELMLRVHLLASKEAFEQELVKRAKVSKLDDPLLSPEPSPMEEEAQTSQITPSSASSESSTSEQPIVPSTSDQSPPAETQLEKPQYQLVFEWNA